MVGPRTTALAASTRAFQFGEVPAGTYQLHAKSQLGRGALQGVQVAAGAGVRYFSPIGPLRLDVGVPLNPRDADDTFQVYISIGQAF